MSITCDECSICLMPLEATLSAAPPKCEHAFHGACLTRWLESGTGCPVCRSKTERPPPADVVLRALHTTTMTWSDLLRHSGLLDDVTDPAVRAGIEAAMAIDALFDDDGAMRRARSWVVPFAEALAEAPAEAPADALWSGASLAAAIVPVSLETNAALADSAAEQPAEQPDLSSWTDSTRRLEIQAARLALPWPSSAPGDAEEPGFGSWLDSVVAHGESTGVYDLESEDEKSDTDEDMPPLEDAEEAEQFARRGAEMLDLSQFTDEDMPPLE
jgi:hypothetical protein